jgi:hypothetical protein
MRLSEVDGSTVLHVDPDAGEFAPTQNITFAGTSLDDLRTGLGLSMDSSESDIIKAMIENGTLRNG